VFSLPGALFEAANAEFIFTEVAVPDPSLLTAVLCTAIAIPESDFPTMLYALNVSLPTSTMGAVRKCVWNSVA
jgi:hypothetical protein